LATILFFSAKKTHHSTFIKLVFVIKLNPQLQLVFVMKK
jgi:hypothetical protein